MERVCREIVFGGICLLVVFIPLPYGGVEEGAIFALEVGVFILGAVWVAGRLGTAIGSANQENRLGDGPWDEIGEKRNTEGRKARRKDGEAGAGTRERARAARIPWPVRALIAAFFVLSVLQIVPLPAGVAKVLSPRIAEIKGGGAEIEGVGGGGGGGGGAWTTLSLAPSLSLYELLKYTAYAVFGYLVYVSVRSKRKARLLVFAMVASGMFQALYGLAEYFGKTHRIFGWKNIHYPGTAFGTFINRNHYSAFLEMLLALSIGYLLARADFFAMKKGGVLSLTLF